MSIPNHYTVHTAESTHARPLYSTYCWRHPYPLCSTYRWRHLYPTSLQYTLTKTLIPNLSTVHTVEGTHTQPLYRTLKVPDIQASYRTHCWRHPCPTSLQYILLKAPILNLSPVHTAEDIHTQPIYSTYCWRHPYPTSQQYILMKAPIPNLSAIHIVDGAHTQTIYST